MRTVVRVGLTAALLAAVCLPSLAAKVTVQGQVIGPDDRPVQDARVLVVYLGPDFKETREFTTQQPACDRDGRFSVDIDTALREAPVQVLVTKPGMAMTWGQVAATEMKPLTLKLGADPVSCVGIVADAEGNPIKDAEVRASSVGGPEPEDRPFSLPREAFPPARTDERGRFEFAGFPSAARISLYVTAEGWDYAHKLVSVPTDATTLIFALNPEAVITGRVVRNGKPVPGVHVQCSQGLMSDSRGHAVSDEAGNYAMHHLSPGTYTVALLEWAPTAIPFVAAPIMGVPVKSRETRVAGDLELVPGGVVTGTVTEDGTGKPVADVSVYVSSLEYPDGTLATSWYGHTDAAGAYTVRVLPGRVRVRCQDRERSFAPRERSVTVAGGEPLAHQDFAVVSPELKGSVFLPDGQPAVGVAVQATILGNEAAPAPTNRTAADGSFQLKVAQPPESTVPWLLVAQDPANDLAAAAFVESAADPTMLRLAPGGYVITQAMDEQDGPVAHVVINACTRFKGGNHVIGVSHAASNDKGMISLGPLPANLPIDVYIGYKWRDLVVDREWQYNQQMTLTEGETRSLPPLRVNVHGRAVEGTVVDKEGQPVAAALVYGTGAAKPALADATGHFKLTGLAARANVWLIAMHPTRPWAAATATDPDQPQDLHLSLLPLATVGGRIVDANGQPVRAQVYVYPEYPNTTQYKRFSVPNALASRLGTFGEGWQTASDQDGIWTISTLLAGLKYSMYAESPDRKSIGRSGFEVMPDRPVDIGDVVLKARE